MSPWPGFYTWTSTIPQIWGFRVPGMWPNLASLSYFLHLHSKSIHCTSFRYIIIINNVSISHMSLILTLSINWYFHFGSSISVGHLVDFLLTNTAINITSKHYKHILSTIYFPSFSSTAIKAIQNQNHPEVISFISAHHHSILLCFLLSNVKGHSAPLQSCCSLTETHFSP